MKEEKINETIFYDIHHNVLRPIVQSVGVRAWFVGGCTRDLISRDYINDIDIITTDPDALIKGIEEFCQQHDAPYTQNPMENGHAVVIRIKSDRLISNHTMLPEYTQLEISKMDYREGMTEDAMLIADALSRDFICNSFYMDIEKDEVFNPLHTTDTISDPTLRTIVPCNTVSTFTDNPVRVFRAMDLICRGYIPSYSLLKRLDHFLEATTHQDLKVYRFACLQIVDKIFRRLASGEYRVDNVINAFNYMMEVNGWYRMVHPVIGAMKDIVHRSSWHHDSVWQHTIQVIYYLHFVQSCNNNVNSLDYWAAFLHDIGKVYTMSVVDGKTHFYDHQKVSVKYAAEILKDSPLSKQDTKYVLSMIEHHMDIKLLGSGPFKPSQYKHIRRLQWKLGEDLYRHLIYLNRADNLASDRLEDTNTQSAIDAESNMRRDHEPDWFRYKIPIDGNDIREALPDLQPKYIGYCIEQLYKVTFSHPEDYENREQCLHYLKTLIKTDWLKKISK